MAGRPSTDLPVLIIGAGVAGLALAQGLRLRAVPFRIFERKSSISNAKQGHRFRISVDGQAALHDVLSPPLQDLLQRTAAERTGFAPRYIDCRTMEFPHRENVDPASSMPVDRAWIRALAMLNLEDSMHFEKEFESYDITDGMIEVKFTDGSITRGSMLVGADGIKSRVRKQLQPDRKLLDLERWAMWGRTMINEDLKKALPPDMFSWGMYLDHESNVQVVVDPMSWAKSVRQESNERLPDFSDYVYWVVCTASQDTDCLPKTVQEKKQFLARVSEAWCPTLKLLLDSAIHELTACIPVLSSKPDIEISSTGQPRITLIGDAAHAMSPMGGSGGDTAIRNAADLARTLAGEGVTDDSIKKFEARMAERAYEKIEYSFRGGKKFWRGKDWCDYRQVET